MCLYMHTHKCVRRHKNNYRSVLCNSKILETSQHLSGGEINCVVSIMEFHKKVKRNKLELRKSIWINSTNIILIKRRQFANEYLQCDIYVKVQHMHQFYL